MSHIATVDVEITNLDDLAAACKRIGLELVRGQQTYKWFGHVIEGDPIPEGFTAEELGRCDHAIVVPGDHSLADIQPYEIGVVKRRDGKPGYQLMWDYNGFGGFGLAEFVGCEFDHKTKNYDGKMPKLKQAYAICAARRVAQLQGFRLQEVATAGGVRMILTK